jgi:type II secretory pathway predicted ATPase ExeA
VPRTATEAVLVRLETALREGSGVVALSGPDGAGKTLLLRILADRLDGDFHSLYVPYPKLAPSEFFHWILGALGSAPGADAESTLHERLACDLEAGFPSQLLLLDDACLAPPETLVRLERLREDLAGHLHLVLVRSEDAQLPREFAHVEEVVLQGRMDPTEMGQYLRTRLDRAAVDVALRARLEGAVELLHMRSEGNPARLHAMASRILCRAGAISSNPALRDGN